MRYITCFKKRGRGVSVKKKNQFVKFATKFIIPQFKFATIDDNWTLLVLALFLGWLSAYNTKSLTVDYSAPYTLKTSFVDFENV